VQALEGRRLLSGGPYDRTVTREFSETVAGFRIDYAQWSYGGGGPEMGSLWIYGPDTDDSIVISRNASLPHAIDFDFNGTRHTIDFADLTQHTNWGISTGGGTNRLEITFDAEDGRAFGFSGFQVYGGSGNDELINGDTPAVLRGEAGDDILRGGAANDSLEGGSGVDKLYGGPGNDRLSVGSDSSPPPPQPGRPFDPYPDVEEGEVYDGGEGDDTFQAPPAPAVPLPDGGRAPVPEPESPPPGAQALPRAPAEPAAGPTHGLALDELFDGDGRLIFDVARRDRGITVESLDNGKFLVGGFTQSPPPDNPNDEGQAGFLLKVNADGTLDQSFGDDGVVMSRFFEEGVTDIALQPNGKILAAGQAWLGWGNGGGDFGVARFNADGSPDTAFGDGGRAAVDVNTGNDRATGIAVAPDGKIVVAGAAGVAGHVMQDPQGNLLKYDEVGVVRFNADGTLDTTFGQDGKVTFDFRNGRRSSFESAGAVAVTAEGKVVLTAHASGTDFTGARRITTFLIRLNADGSPDASFSGDGMVTLYDPDRPSSFGGMLLRGDGAVIAVLNVFGPATQPHGFTPATTEPLLLRFRPDGTLDEDFGEGGVVRIAGPGPYFAAGGLRELADGTLAVVGRASDQPGGASYERIFVATFDADAGSRLRFAQSGAGFEKVDDIGFVGASGELLVVGQRPVESSDAYAHDADVSVYRLKVVDDVNPPGPTPDPQPQPPGWPTPPTPPTEPPPTPEPVPEPEEPIDPPVRGPVELRDAPTLSARFSGRRAVAKGSAYTFRVTYRADAGSRIDPASLGNGDAIVTGPGGFARQAELVRTRANKAGTRVTTTYRVSAPGGSFDAADNGTYAVRLPPGAVAADEGTTGESSRTLTLAPPGSTGGQAIGSFLVRAKTPRAAQSPPANRPAAAPRTARLRATEDMFSDVRIL
jgi:uncharacterized delta-60 repeat protein